MSKTKQFLESKQGQEVGKGGNKTVIDEKSIQQFEAEANKLANEPDPEKRVAAQNAFLALQETRNKMRQMYQQETGNGLLDRAARKQVRNYYRDQMKHYSSQLDEMGYGGLAGKYFKSQGDKEGPAAIAEAGAKIAPNYAPAQRDWMNAELDAGNYEDAKDAGMQAMQLNPEHPEPYVGVSKASYELRDYEDAYQFSKRALDINPRDYRARTINRLSVQRLGDRSDTARADAGAVPVVAAKAASAMRTAPAYRQFAQPSAAADGRASEQLLASKLYANKAMTLLQQGDAKAAAQAAVAALRANPTNLRARVAYIKALEKTGRHQLMLYAVNEALRYHPNNSMLLAMRAGAFNHMKQYKDALASATGAIVADSKNPEAYLQKAWALDGMGRKLERNQALELARQYGGAGTKYEQVWEKVNELDEGELAAWLAGENLPPKEQAAKGVWGKGFENRRLLTLGLTSIVGGFLIALGLLRSFSSRWKALMHRIALAFGRESPRLETHAAAAGLPGGNGASRDVGEILSRGYDVRRELGVGGMGIVYEAVDRALQRRVAVKKMRDEIRSDPRERERFLVEARTVATLHHPNIVEIFSIVEDGRDAFLIFEFVDGKDVNEVLHKKKRLTFTEAVSVLRGVTAALDYAHSRRVVHRDLKPSNIMVSKEGRVKVMDFGVARMAKDSLSRVSRTNTVVGTPPYMAPEQEQGRVCSESDIYALAVMLYEMVTGRLPFEGVGAGMLMAKLNKTYVPAGRVVSGLPAGFDAALDRALEPEPEKRWKTAGEFLSSLDALSIPR
ncbi:MAG: protein kinase [Elusimicrobiota bacterium]